MFTLKPLTSALLVVVAASGALASEWATLRIPNIAAGVTQDDAKLVVACDQPERRLVWMVFGEPRANWQVGAEMEVVTTSDEGSEQSIPSHGTVLEPTSVMIEEDATWDLFVMGKSRTSFNISAGGYTRTFPTANLRKAVEPVLQACGDGWGDNPAED